MKRQRELVCHLPNAAFLLTLSDLAKYSMTRSIVQRLIRDSGASYISKTQRYFSVRSRQQHFSSSSRSFFARQ